jgi:hypothetical protein
MSVQRAYAQRNNNITPIVPIYSGILPTELDLSGSAVYTLSIPKIQYVGGIYTVDLGGVDASGNLLNFDGIIEASGNSITNINFILDSSSAQYYPGLEFTIFFRNFQAAIDRFAGPPLLTIGLISDIVGAPPVPYIFSPPLPPLFTNGSVNLTFKSDGERFSVTSGGPAGWLGIGALYVILAAAPNIGG